MISKDKIKNGLFDFMAAYSREMVLYDAKGKRVFDPSEDFINIWCNDIRIYVKILYGRIPTLHTTVMGTRSTKEITELIDALQSFCSSNLLVFKIDINDSDSTPSKENKKNLAEALYFDFSKLKKKSLPTSVKDDKLSSSIDNTYASLFDVLTSTTSQLINLDNERIEKCTTPLQSNKMT